MTFWGYVSECVATTLSIMPVCFGIQVDGYRSPYLYLHESNEGSLLTRVPRVLNVSLAVSWMSAGKGPFGQFVRSGL